MGWALDFVNYTNGTNSSGGAQVEVRLPFGNPAGVTFTGPGFGNNFAFQPQVQVQSAEQPQQIEEAQPHVAEVEPVPQEQPQLLSAQPQQEIAQEYAGAPGPAQVQQFNNYAAHGLPLQYHRAIQYAPPPAPVLHQKLPFAPQPAVALHQKIGYASTPVLTKVQGVADVPVTKLAYSQGFTQQEVDVAQPAVSTRKVKVRRPALRKEFYDIEHRVIVRPAGSATLELSQPISKEQQGPAVLTATNYAHIAPVVRYGASRRIIDGSGQSGAFAQERSEPVKQSQQGPTPAQPESPIPRNAQPQAQEATSRTNPPPPLGQPERQQLRQAVDADTEVVEAEQGREDIPTEPQQQQTGQNEQPQPLPEAPQQPSAAHAQDNGRGLTITPDMPLALQNRLLELLTAKGGTVTEILNKDGTPADSASVLQVTDALGDPQLQGGERITTRRIVVTRPIETIQEIEVQEPATKIHRKLVQQPALFKHHVPAVARVPVAVPAVKHVATPVVKTTYAAAHPAAYSFNYQTPQFSYSH